MLRCDLFGSSRTFDFPWLPPIRELRRRVTHKCPVFTLLSRLKIGNLFFIQWPPTRVALECGHFLSRPVLDDLLTRVERLFVGTSARTRIRELDGIVLPSADRTDVVGAINLITYRAKTTTWTRQFHTQQSKTSRTGKRAIQLAGSAVEGSLDLDLPFLHSTREGCGNGGRVRVTF